MDIISKFEDEVRIAEECRKRCLDPLPYVEIQVANDLAERVENLIGRNVAERIRSFGGISREEIAIRVCSGFAEMGGNREKIVEIAVRTAVAILTEGVVAAPIEGISGVEKGRNDGGGEYVKVFYAGPIRSAGGTAQALSILIADYLRRKLGFQMYKPREEEIERYIEEVMLYERISSLQYTPTEEEIRLIVENCPICIDGEGTEEREIEVHRNLQRVETNRVRGGMVLVLAEGIALKAKKLKKHVDRLGIDGWEWLDSLARKEVKGKNDAFLKDVIAGRPVFSYPSAKGGFRLRYGRARNTGLSAVGINPATMIILDDFIAPGTQMKMEMPGKAVCVSPVDSIQGPTVRLLNGDVVRIDKIEDAYEFQNEVSKILDLGEILISYGDFIENNHPLAPAGYCEEWWEQLPEENLHPDHTYLWHDIDMDEFKALANYVSENGMFEDGLFIPEEKEIKTILEKLLVLHKLRNGKILIEDGITLIRCLGLDANLEKNWKDLQSKAAIEAAATLSGLKIHPKALTRIGGRMGRPEKSAPRKMKPAPHVLFPVGSTNRSIADASGEVEAKIGGKRRKIDIRSCYSAALKGLKEEEKIDVKGVKGVISKDKVAEPIEKGILRAKHEVFVFKDGTIRYDMTNLPLTHFEPREINVDPSRLRDLGYYSDSTDQLVELKVQDVILSDDASAYLLRASHFIDDLLVKYYDLPPYYNARKKEDLIGSLIIGLAPHTSAGMLGRILGFTSSSVCYAHPFFHAAKRRNCDGDEDSVMLLMDALINFSRCYLPEKRGGRMDAPLMLMTRIRPDEIDSEAMNMDSTERYPLAFYEKRNDFEIDLIRQIKESFRFTHDTSDISLGPSNSVYKHGTMTEKTEAQLNLAKKIMAVDENDVAERVINSHFIPDLKGNIRAFSSQKFRCMKCNKRYRRPPLMGRCECGGRLILTVHEGSVRKYMDISMRIADEYEISGYTKQRLEMIKEEIESMFGGSTSLSAFM
jgi:DNA polymerase II large subunit